MRVKDGVGAYGENVAVRHLEESGLVVIDRNWRCDAGEIDIVAMDGDEIVVCEVKTRSGLGYGSGLEAVTRDKRIRLRRLAQAWLAANDRRGARLRIDVIAVHRGRSGPHIEHVQGAC